MPETSSTTGVRSTLCPDCRSIGAHLDDCWRGDIVFRRPAGISDDAWRASVAQLIAEFERLVEASR